MRQLTEKGWSRLYMGFSLPSSQHFVTEIEFWSWAVRQGSGFRLAAYFLIGMLGGYEDEFPGFDEIRSEAHPVRLAWGLDDKVRSMIVDILAHPSDYMR